MPRDSNPKPSTEPPCQFQSRPLLADGRILCLTELDEDGSGELDWNEYKAALKRLSIRLPVNKMREVFESLDEDKQGTVSYDEMSKVLFPRQDWVQV